MNVRRIDGAGARHGARPGPSMRRSLLKLKAGVAGADCDSESEPPVSGTSSYY